MPLRKQGNIIPAGALALALSAALIPASASASYVRDYSAPTRTTTTTTAPAATTPATTTTTAAATTTTTTTTPVATTPAVTGATSCTALPTTKSFSSYGDNADYFLAPGGGFETGTTTGWSLTSGAKIVSANENLGIQGGNKALELPVGATATSPAFCVDDSNPSFRFTSKLSSLDGGYIALVLYRDAAGTLKKSQFLSSADGSYYNKATDWNPSPVSPLATGIPLLSGGGKTATAQLMFVGTTKAYGMFVGAKATIDSVMVDPYRRG